MTVPGQGGASELQHELERGIPPKCFSPPCSPSPFPLASCMPQVLPHCRACVLHVKAETQQTRWRITTYMCFESLPEQRINMPKITPMLTAVFK